MSALDGAYKAAADGIEGRGAHTHPHGHEYARYYGSEQLSRFAVDAFLAHLAANPPEEMVEAMRARESDVNAPLATHHDLLVAALRAIGGER